MSDETAAHGNAFLRDVIRILALIGLGHAALQLVQYVLHFFFWGTWWEGARGGVRLADRAIQLSRLGAILLLLVGAIGLLKWKPWARPAVLWWAIVTLLLNAVASLPWLVQYAQDISAATTQWTAGQQPFWHIVLWTLLSSIDSLFLPLLFLLILRRPEAASLFERTTGGGFDVVPMARPVATATRDGGGPAGG